MADDGKLDVKRGRGLSISIRCSGDSHGRIRYPEKLVDNSRRTTPLGLTKVDNGAAISASLANVVARKACLLELKMKDTSTEAVFSCWGQAGLIQGHRLTSSPSDDSSGVQPAKKRRTADGADSSEKPALAYPKKGVLRSSRFEATPITCIHNVEDEINDGGVAVQFLWSEIKPAFSENQIVDFEKARYNASEGESIVVFPADQINDEICWEYHDVTTASKNSNAASPLTVKDLGFTKMTRDGYEFRVGQKIGISVIRNFDLAAEDAGMTDRSITPQELREIYGEKDCVNIYTGQITYVSPSGQTFGHNINTFKGCSGAVIFLLDQGQDGCGVEASDYGKAIAIHGGGDRLQDGTIINFGFKIL